MDVIGIPSNSKIDNRDQTDATMLNSIYEKGGIDLTKLLLKICSIFLSHTMLSLTKMLQKRMMY